LERFHRIHERQPIRFGREMAPRGPHRATHRHVVEPNPVHCTKLDLPDTPTLTYWAIHWADLVE